MRGDVVISSEHWPDTTVAEYDLLLLLKGSLQQQGHGLHRTLALSVERGVVVVQGRAPTYHLRQVAVEGIKRVAGVTQVIDRIEVVYVPNDGTVKECPGGEWKTSTNSTEPCSDLPDMARAEHRGSQSHIQLRGFLTAAKG